MNNLVILHYGLSYNIPAASPVLQPEGNNTQ